MNQYPKPRNCDDLRKLERIINSKNSTEKQVLDAAERILDGAYGTLPARRKDTEPGSACDWMKKVPPPLLAQLSSP